MAKGFLNTAKNLVRPFRDVIASKRREAELRRQKPHVGKARLLADLMSLPLQNGSPVLVHSSLKSIGFVEGGVDTVLDAMIEVVVVRRGGTLIIPTYSIDGMMAQTMRSRRSFDVRSTPSNLGKLPAAFSARSDTVRSVHPTHSFAAMGRDATWFVEGQLAASTNFGPDTPMMRVKERDGHICGLGTSLGAVTFYHTLEDCEPDFPRQVYTEDSPFRITVTDASGQAHEKDYFAHNNDFSHRIDYNNSMATLNYFERRLQRDAGMSWYEVGEASCWLLSARRFYDCQLKMMREGITVYATPDEIAAANSVDAAP
ncbi:MAG: AAC(3) family N-acetyltransferase [Pacificimonas sp.]